MSGVVKRWHTGPDGRLVVDEEVSVSCDDGAHERCRWAPCECSCHQVIPEPADPPKRRRRRAGRPEWARRDPGPWLIAAGVGVYGAVVLGMALWAILGGAR